jgi:hypothetical protein
MQRLTAIALIAVASTVGAQDFPKLKAGLWTTTMTTPGREKQEARVSTLCLDDSVQQEMYKMSTGMMAGMCSKHDLKITANKVTTEAVCDLGASKMRSESVMTLTGNSAYHTEAHASFDPPMNGMKESTTIIDGKHVGPCKPGQQPGDMTLPNGQTMNIRQMMGRKG